MSAIDPKHKKRFVIDVYTSAEMTKQKFEDYATSVLVCKELELNSVHPKLRWHLKTSNQEAD